MYNPQRPAKQKRDETKEREVLSALSAKYLHAIPGSSLTSESLQKLGGSSATISQDYTGSKEEKEIATLKLLAKKYEGSGVQGFAGPPAQSGGDKNTNALLDVDKWSFSNPGDGNMDVLQDFDFDSFLHQDVEGADGFNFDSSTLFDGNEDIGHNQASLGGPNPTSGSSKHQTPAVKPQRLTKKRRIHWEPEQTSESKRDIGSLGVLDHIDAIVDRRSPTSSLPDCFPIYNEDIDIDEATYELVRQYESHPSPDYQAILRQFEELDHQRSLSSHTTPAKRTDSIPGPAPNSRSKKATFMSSSNPNPNKRRLPSSYRRTSQINSSNGLTTDSTRYGLLQDMISRLQEDKKQLQLQLSQSRLPLWKTLYRVHCATGGLETYSDVPVSYGKRRGHIQGQDIAEDIELFIARQHGRVCFVVFQQYHCCQRKSKVCDKTQIPTKRQGHSPDSGLATSGEEIRIVSRHLSEALEYITEQVDHDDNYYPRFQVGCVLKAPYFWYYHNRGKLEDASSDLDKEQKSEFRLFKEYLSQNIEREYNEADAMISNSKITARYFDYLFSPNTVLLQSDAKATSAFVEEEWPRISTSQFRLEGDEYLVIGYTLQTQAWHWSFDGFFQKTPESTSLRFKTMNDGEDYLALDEEIDIDSLPVYPLKYAKPGVERALRDRGEKFWSCRHRNYVAYHGRDYRSDEVMADTRFMVDLATFYKMHSDKQPHVKLVDQLGKDAMAREKPPGGNFCLLLPGKIHGFNMQEKRWVDLQVEHITNVDWNKEAFTSLVADSETKDLITALVTNQLAAERATDLMSGKGTGLIILLHGGPGTGKTLTAESVAEIAEKPLYRVTCGDIPTAPDAVEKYLETVLLLGKTWGCVVLLDEADVFLEQRTLQDLQRNALVSVFLRVLEYYDGILILTSNRVGTFDEAFKSRIQLALHYESLNKDQRRQIWKIFIKRLEGFQTDSTNNEAVDTENLRDHLDELSNHDMNGRQIRNAVTTARQLAVHKKQKMDITHLNHVIKVAQSLIGICCSFMRGFRMRR